MHANRPYETDCRDTSIVSSLRDLVRVFDERGNVHSFRCNTAESLAVHVNLAHARVASTLYARLDKAISDIERLTRELREAREAIRFTALACSFGFCRRLCTHFNCDGEPRCDVHIDHSGRTPYEASWAPAIRAAEKDGDSDSPCGP